MFFSKEKKNFHLSPLKNTKSKIFFEKEKQINKFSSNNIQNFKHLKFPPLILSESNYIIWRYVPLKKMKCFRIKKSIDLLKH